MMTKFAQLAKWALLLVGAALFLNAVALAINTNMHHGHIIQIILSIVVTTYALLMHKFSRKIHITAIALSSIPAIFALSLYIYGTAGNHNFTEDVVIVLGAGLRGEEVGGHLALRLNAAIEYLEQNDNALVIVCGGLGAAQTITEAEAMFRYLTAQGIAAERIIKEEKSTTTQENLLFAKEILSEHLPDGFRAVLITNDFHIYRASTMARNIGLDIVPLGARTPGSTLGVNYLREMFAVMHFWVFGG